MSVETGSGAPLSSKQTRGDNSEGNDASDFWAVVVIAAQAIRDEVNRQKTKSDAQSSTSPTDSDDASTESEAGPQSDPELGDRLTIRVNIGGADVLAVRPNEGEDQLALWRQAREATRSSGHYPVLVEFEMLEYIEQTQQLPPGQTAERMSVLRSELIAQETWPLDHSLGIARTVERYGRGPTESYLSDSQAPQSELELDGLLWKWERSQFSDEEILSKAKPDEVYWHEESAEDTVLLILPVPDGSAAIGILGFHPVEDQPEWLAPLGNDLAHWSEMFGAELVANYGTMLQFIVERPPTDLDTAYQLATEHHMVGNATLALPGHEVRHYAADLVGRSRWHLHDRP